MVLLQLIWGIYVMKDVRFRIIIMADIITSPFKFLGATVLSFNTTLGLGSAEESTLNVDLVEDCEAGDSFLPATNSAEVGAPCYFTITGDGGAILFSFGGVLTNWTVNQGGSGKTFNVKVVDPRQLLENTIVITDSYAGNPVTGANYFNVYAAYENTVLEGNCNTFGSSQSNEAGMPYIKIISKLQELDPTIKSPTGYEYKIDFSTFPVGVPDFYKIPGPGISILQLLQEVCGVVGLEFYCYLEGVGGNHVIKVGTVNLSNPPGSFATIIGAFDGIATEISYGEELRNEKTKSLIFGEKQHYLSYVDEFDYFFGEDLINGELVPVVPFGNNKSGFWIKKRVEQLNQVLFKPLPNNGPYTISELDIRAAMSSYQAWRDRALDKSSKGTLNQAIRANYPDCNKDTKQAIDDAAGNNGIHPDVRNRRTADRYANPTAAGAAATKPKNEQDLEAIHAFVQNLGNTYYGKQWISKLKETICRYPGENFQEKIYTSIPTNAGGWIEGSATVIGLSEPELTFFRAEDGRVNCFALFNTGGNGNAGEAEETGTVGDDNNDDGDGPYQPGGTGD